MRGKSVFYLFGSMHVLPPKLQWQSPCLEEVISQSDTIWFEAPTKPSGGRRYNAYFNWLLQRQGNVGTLLDTDELNILRLTAKSLGLSYEWLASKPLWHAEAILASGRLKRKQYYNRYGVEWVLEERAHNAKINVRYLESAAQQRRMMETMPVHAQRTSLLRTIHNIRNNDDRLDSMAKAWSEGDLGYLFTILNREVQTEIQHRLIRVRNKNWVEQIHEAAQNTDGVRLLVVGAGHVSGPDSLVHLLRGRGFIVQRIN